MSAPRDYDSVPNAPASLSVSDLIGVVTTIVALAPILIIAAVQILQSKRMNVLESRLDDLRRDIDVKVQVQDAVLIMIGGRIHRS